MARAINTANQASILVALRERKLVTGEKRSCFIKDNRIFGFKPNHMFDDQSSNDDVFSIVAKPIVDDALNGINGSILAYGQTGSGKTYTMFGTSSDPGVVLLATEHIFKVVNDRRKSYQFVISMKYIEVYGDTLRDLLDGGKATSFHLGQIASTEKTVSDASALLKLKKDGDVQRTIKATNRNDHSSRSHAILQIKLESTKIDANGLEGGKALVSMLNFVDLAGSEPHDAGKTKDQQAEGNSIRAALCYLSAMVKSGAVTGNLCKILKESILGNCKTAFICTVSPSMIAETRSTIT
ncbi:uncharacterized protein LOC129568137 [Sitodiplosis mosellana]|uniref:uncharacterized protein LOC129568137 n=1 Tax=Sitodiplosis mosellana TaxID=263140 RepID=UPI002444B129|nr:uncharacterized protein LOC129568137 [Sitodiplosis mosellana]